VKDAAADLASDERRAQRHDERRERQRHGERVRQPRKATERPLSLVDTTIIFVTVVVISYILPGKNGLKWRERSWSLRSLYARNGDSFKKLQ